MGQIVASSQYQVTQIQTPSTATSPVTPAQLQGTKKSTGRHPGSALSASLPFGRWVGGEHCLGEVEQVGRSFMM